MNKEFISQTRGNIISERNNDVLFTWDKVSRVRFNELKDFPDQENEVRAFGITDQGLRLQFRASDRLTENGKVRDLIATAFIAKEDLEYLLERMKDPYKKI